MNAQQLLTFVIDRVSEAKEPTLFSYDELKCCDDGVIDRFLKLGLLTEEVKASTLICQGCEEACLSDVHTLDAKQRLRAFIICEHSEMQSQMGRVNVPLERLGQWQSTSVHFAKVVADLLALDKELIKPANGSAIRIGMLKSRKGNRWVSLLNDLGLELNNYQLPIEELICFENETLTIDKARIDDVLKRKPVSDDKGYLQTVDQREKNKAETQAMYRDWQDEYERLKRPYPNNTKGWYARKIAKSDLAQGRSASRIERCLK